MGHGIERSNDQLDYLIKAGIQIHSGKKVERVICSCISSHSCREAITKERKSALSGGYFLN